MTKAESDNTRGETDMARLRREPERPEPEIISDLAGEAEGTPNAGHSELHVHQFFGILRRRLSLIVTLGFCGAILAIAAAVLVPPRYTAKAQVVVEPEQVPSSAGGRIQAVGVTAMTIDTQIAMLAARDHLRAVLASLMSNPAFLQTKIEPRSSASAADENAERKPDGFGGLLRSTREFVAGLRSLVSKRERIPSFDEFERTLRIDQERHSRVISVRYTSESAEQAAAIVNRVVELYLQKESGQIRQASQAELSQLASRIGELERTLETTETTIRQKLTTLGDGSSSTPFSGAQLRKLETDAAEQAQLYVSLLERQKRLRSQQGTTAASISILSLADPPERPSSASPEFIILPAVILALIGGGIFAVVVERFDRTLRSRHQVESLLGVPCMALVPKLGWRSRRHSQENLLKEPFSPFTEAVRSISASLQFGTPGHTPKAVLITSSDCGDGKTTLATSLATYAASQDRRVLLVELNFHNPGLAQALEIEGGKGISHVLASPHTLNDTIQHVPGLRFDLLPLQGTSVEPMSIFANDGLKSLLNLVRTRYDLVIIDGPPLLGGIETALLASLVDQVIFVIKWGRTRGDIAQNALSELRVLGWSKRTVAERVRAVLTSIDFPRHARYCYGDSVEVFRKQSARTRRRHKAQSVADRGRSDQNARSRQDINPVAAE